jgi:hypothetical protein
MLKTIFGSLLLLGAIGAQAAHPLLCCDYGGNKVCVLSSEGAITWQYDCRNPQDCWRLANGNYLVCFVNGARELTPDAEKRVVWEYKAPAGVEVHACQPLADGRVLVVEGGTSRLVEVDRNGMIAKEIKLSTTVTNTHNQFRGTRKIANGHYLVCFKGEGKVVELDQNAAVVRTIKVPGDPHEVLALPNGHLLITCGDGHKIQEYDSNSKIVWELNEFDLPGNPLRLAGGCMRLPNGNTIFCNYLGHGHIGEQPQVVEITADKKVVWAFSDHARFNSINQLQALDVTGDPVAGEISR